MVEKQRKHRNTKLFRFCICSLLALFLCVFLLPCISPQRAFADDTEYTYTTVLEDLQKDSSFNKDDYPNKDNDYSLQVIQIAESVNKELFVYVYQPTSKKELTATSINISTALNDSLKYINYTLQLVSRENQFHKYVVKDFVVKDDALRYYAITSIFRAWDSTIDTEAPGDNTINEVSFAVAKLFTACTVNGQISYTCTQTDVVEITDKYVGFVRYDNGFNLYANSCDSHYVAFSTDKAIDKLLEADITFVVRTIKYDNLGSDTYGDYNTQFKTLYYDECVSNNPGWFVEKRTWTRIEKASDFVNNEDLLDDVIKQVEKKQFVLRFYESDYVTNGQYIKNFLHKWGTYDEVSSVTILRLSFETDGTAYNLGVVDNKQSGDVNPDNHVSNWFADFIDRIIAWFKSLFGNLGSALGSALSALLLIAIIIGIVLLILYFPPIIKFICNLFKYLFLGLWYIIKYLAIALWYILKYIGLGIYWIFAWPFYLKK